MIRARELPLLRGVANTVFDCQPGQKPHATIDTKTLHLPPSMDGCVFLNELNAYVFRTSDSHALQIAGCVNGTVFAGALAHQADLQKIENSHSVRAQFISKLQPSALRQYASVYKLELQQQGKLWFAPLPNDTSDLRRFLGGWGRNGLRGLRTAEFDDRRNRHRIFDTNHYLQGHLYKAHHRRLELLGRPVEIVKGRVIAPHYRRLDLTRPHIVQLTDAFLD